MLKRVWLVALVAALAMPACAKRPDESNLRESFTAQIAKISNVTDLALSGDVLTFLGPDGRDGTASWLVRIDSIGLSPGSSELLSHEGHILSSWWRDGELIEPLGAMSGLPDVFLDIGIAQDCYALWDTVSNTWDW